MLNKIDKILTNIKYATELNTKSNEIIIHFENKEEYDKARKKHIDILLMSNKVRHRIKYQV